MSWASFHVSDCRSTLSFSTAASCGSTRIYEPSRGWSPFGFPPTFAILSCTQIFVDLGECFWGHVPRSPCVLSKPPRRMQERAGLRGATQETKGLVWVAACRVLFPGAQEAGGGPYQRGEGRNSVLHKHTKRGFTVQEAPAYSRPDRPSALVALAISQSLVLGPSGTRFPGLQVGSATVDPGGSHEDTDLGSAVHPTGEFTLYVCCAPRSSWIWTSSSHSFCLCFYLP